MDNVEITMFCKNAPVYNLRCQIVVISTIGNKFFDFFLIKIY